VLGGYTFDPALAWEFTREVGSMMGRVLNVVAVWGATSVCASRLGVVEGAAHVLLFQIVSIASITAVGRGGPRGDRGGWLPGCKYGL